MAGRRQLGTPRKRGDGEKSLRLVILILSSHGDPGCERLIHGGGRRFLRRCRRLSGGARPWHGSRSTVRLLPSRLPYL